MAIDIGIYVSSADSDGDWGGEAQGLTDKCVEVGHLVHRFCRY